MHVTDSRYMHSAVPPCRRRAARRRIEACHGACGLTTALLLNNTVFLRTEFFLNSSFFDANRHRAEFVRSLRCGPHINVTSPKHHAASISLHSVRKARRPTMQQMQKRPILFEDMPAARLAMPQTPLPKLLSIRHRQPTIRRALPRSAFPGRRAQAANDMVALPLAGRWR